MSSNLCRDGIIVQAGDSLQPGQAVQLSFRLPEQKSPIEALGSVVYVNESQRVGVRFTEIRSEDRQHIYDFLVSQVDAL